MNSRQLNKRVEIYSTASVSDGYGGYTNNDALVGTSWAKISTLKPSFLQLNYGLQEGQRSVEVVMRKRNDLVITEGSHFLKYRSKKYTITQGPVLEDFRDRFIRMICTESNDKANASGNAPEAPTLSLTESSF